MECFVNGNKAVLDKMGNAHRLVRRSWRASTFRRGASGKLLGEHCGRYGHRFERGRKLLLAKICERELAEEFLELRAEDFLRKRPMTRDERRFWEKYEDFSPKK